jgi:DNA replication protein DnaC
MGPTGAGKTSLAVAMLDAWVRLVPRKRKGSLFVEAAWLARSRARHKLGDGESPLVAQALSAPLLLLDDLGQEREDRDGCITDVVYGRSNADLPTWVTCGLATKDQTLEAFTEALSRRYDGGFVRRIIETGKRVRLGR